MELQVSEDLLKKKISISRKKLIADIILILLLSGIFGYIYSEIENFKTLRQDVCRLCEKKTGGTCLLNPNLNLIDSNTVDKIEEINFSKLIP